MAFSFGGISSAGKFVGSVMNTTAGMQFRQGVGETLGFDYASKSMIEEGYNVSVGQNLGFLGRNTPTRNLLRGERIVRTLDKTGGIRGTGGMLGQGKFAFASRVFGIATLGLSAISGYQENGVTGATMNVAKEAASWGAMRAGWSVGKGVLANPFFLVPATIGALGYAGYKIGQASREKARRIRNVEMGGEVIDRFGTLSTIRQRSLMALNNSHVNGRMALGNEATLLSTNYLR